MTTRTTPIAAELLARGSVCHISVLIRAGISRDRVERAATRGEIRRVRPGWYAVGTSVPELLTAVRAGGAVTCVSALRLRGAWAIDDELLHIRVRRGNTSSPSAAVRRHWSDEPVLAPMDDALTAARCVIRCLPTEHAVAVLDSALRLGLVTGSDLRRESSARARRVIAHLDPRSESGLESLARLRLRHHRIRLRTQVKIAGVGRVDILIGDRLILELDGEEWHDFEEDRARDRRAMVRRYLPIRASYRQVMFEWDALEAELLTLIRRREHLWRRGAAGSHRSAPARPRRRQGEDPV
jgi:very-short-patch-repair endonuclease